MICPGVWRGGGGGRSCTAPPIVTADTGPDMRRLVGVAIPEGAVQDVLFRLQGSSQNAAIALESGSDDDSPAGAAANPEACLLPNAVLLLCHW